MHDPLQLSLLDKKNTVDVVFQGHLLVTVIVASVMEVLGLRCDQDEKREHFDKFNMFVVGG